MQDATGKELIIDTIYGYSVDNNGLTHVITGRFLGYTIKNYAGLEVIESKRAYGNVNLESYITEKKKVFVKSNKLFKICQE